MAQVMTAAAVDSAAYRRDWPYLDSGLLWLQHAGITPPNQRVVAAGQRALQQFATDPLSYTGLYRDATDGARAKVARLLDTDPERLALVKNTSQGLLFVAESLPWQAGDQVVTLGGEYPANRLCWRALERFGVSVVTVAPDAAGRFTIDAIAAAITDATRVVAVSWVQYINGFRLDLEALGEVCRRRGVWLVVDGVQGAGVLPVPLAAVDAFVSGGHKWLMATEGAGFLYLNPRLLERLQPFNVSWNSTVERLDKPGDEVFDEGAMPPLKPTAQRFEEGTANTVGQLMLGEAATLLNEIGPARIFERLMRLQDHLLERLRPRGYEVVSPQGEGERSGILALRHPDHEPGALLAALQRERIVAIVRANHLRLAAAFYNTTDEMDRVVAALP